MTEAVFDVLLAALAVELVLRGLVDLVIIDLVGTITICRSLATSIAEVGFRFGTVQVSQLNRLDESYSMR